MEDLAIISTSKTISSLEISELTGKRHKNVLRDIRVLMDSVSKTTQLIFEPSNKQACNENSNKTFRYKVDCNDCLEYVIQESSYTDSTGRDCMMYILNQSASYWLASGYSPILRAKIVSRWMNLEVESRKQAVALPQNYIEALEALVASEKEKVALQQENREQKAAIAHKTGVIEGLTEEIDLAEKRQRICQIVRYNTSDFQYRWRLLYKEFELKYHVSLNRRINGKKALEIKPEIKNKMDYIDRVMGMIPELYELACKLFETDVKKLINREWKIYQL